jgi:hypothetical protein
MIAARNDITLYNNGAAILHLPNIRYVYEDTCHFRDMQGVSLYIVQFVKYILHRDYIDRSFAKHLCKYCSTSCVQE